MIPEGKLCERKKDSSKSIGVLSRFLLCQVFCLLLRNYGLLMSLETFSSVTVTLKGTFPPFLSVLGIEHARQRTLPLNYGTI